MLKQSWQGIIVPAVTPFTNEGTEVDWDSFRVYIERLMKEPIQGIILNGTTGESPTVSWDEVIEMVRIAQDIRQDRPIPIMVGTGTNDTASTLRRTEHAGKLGADAVLAVVPYYNKPSQQGIIEHFRLIARSGVPVFAYDNPSRTGVSLTIETAVRILAMDGVVGLKDSTGDTKLMSGLSHCTEKPVFCGDDANLMNMLQAGASGGILASANLYTSLFAEVYRLYISDQADAAESLFNRLLPLIRLLFRESNPAPLKWVLHRSGLIQAPTVRLPLTGISSGLQQELDELIDRNA